MEERTDNEKPEGELFGVFFFGGGVNTEGQISG